MKKACPERSRRVYLDYAATTPVDPRVLKVMMPFFRTKFGNPSSVHLWGQEARAAVENAREQVAKSLNCKPREVYFTGTTTTSDNLAIQGVVRAAKKKGQKCHLITSAIEHHAVLDTCQAMEKNGHGLTIIGVDKHGLVKLDELKKALRPEAVLVSIMSANNEVGTIQPIAKIGKLISDLRTKNPALPAGRQKLKTYFHTDAAAVVDYLDLNTQKLGVDLMTIGAHKFGGPKGIGALFVKDGVEIEPITFCGHKERRLWPGTESVPLIVGLAEALEIASHEKNEAAKRVTGLRDKLIKGVLAKIPKARLTGHPSQRLPDIASFVINGVEGEAMLLMLSEAGIAASSGSACTSGVLKPSHVLTAMGIRPEDAHGSLRFSLGKKTTEKEINYVLEVLPKIVAKLRKMAPKF